MVHGASTITDADKEADAVDATKSEEERKQDKDD